MNRVMYVLDASGSMQNRVAKTIAMTLASIAKLPDSDVVSILTFEGNSVNLIINKVKSRDVGFTSSDYRIGGMTNLRDAVSDGCDTIKKGSRSGDTFVVIVLTDGGENSSKRISQAQLVIKLATLQATDHWTFAWLVPPECVEATKSLGIDSSNIFGWTDIEKAANALSGGMDNLTTARSRGATALKSGFFADLSGTKKRLMSGLK